MNLQFSLLEQSFSSRDVVLTSTPLLAQRFQSAYATHQAEKGYTSFPVPTIISITEWIERLWKENLFNNQSSQLLLNHSQNQVLWETLSQTPPTSIANIAKFAYEAWIFHITDQNSQVNQVEDNSHVILWKKWACDYKKKCHQQDWIEKHAFISQIINKDLLKKSLLPHTIFLLGLNSSNPLYSLFFKYLEKKGCNIDLNLFYTEKKSSLIQSIVLSDNDEEIFTMARWAWQEWKTGHHSIGCAIPQLSERRHQIITIFQTVYQELFQQSFAFNDVLGFPLEENSCINHPMIQIALDVLMPQSPLNLNTISRLLLSPYLGNWEQEKFQRIKLDQSLRAKNNLWITTQQLLAQTQQNECHYLTKVITQWEITLHDLLPSQWAEYFTHQLTLYGWPNQGSLSSTEREHLKSWQELLHDFSSLDVVASPLSYTSALQKLKQMLKDKRCHFQSILPKRGIQLVDTIDAPYFIFNKLWIITTDIEKASNTIFNPFLTHSLQSKLLPNVFTTPPVDLLIRLGHTVVVSQIGKDLPLFKKNGSPSIPDIPIKFISLTDIERPLSTHRVNHPIQWEYFQDDQATPLLEKTIVSGGVDLIKQQAICPFKAFVDYRLDLKHHSLLFPQSVLTYVQRAKILHYLLKDIWYQLKNLSSLKKLSIQAIDQLLISVIDSHIQPLAKQDPIIWKPIFLKIEKKRIYKLLKQCLMTEKNRPDFSIVALEKNITLTLGKLTLLFTIDRIDQLSNGIHLMIDYKTSAKLPSYKDWLDERPTAPQLPLYSLTQRNTIQALTFLQLTAEYPGKFYGLSAEEVYISGIKTIPQKTLKDLSITNWPMLLQHWHTNLKEVARQFQTGYAGVAPKSKLTSCRYCRYSLLCRIAQPVFPPTLPSL